MLNVACHNAFRLPKSVVRYVKKKHIWIVHLCWTLSKNILEKKTVHDLFVWGTKLISCFDGLKNEQSSSAIKACLPPLLCFIHAKTGMIVALDHHHQSLWRIPSNEACKWISSNPSSNRPLRWGPRMSGWIWKHFHVGKASRS